MFAMPAPGGRPVDGGVVAADRAADVSSGPAVQAASGRPTTAAAAPPRSRLRREIRGDELFAHGWGTPHDRVGERPRRAFIRLWSGRGLAAVGWCATLRACRRSGPR